MPTKKQKLSLEICAMTQWGDIISKVKLQKHLIYDNKEKTYSAAWEGGIRKRMAFVP